MEISTRSLADNLAEAIHRVSSAGERVVLTRKKKGVAVLVSMDDLAVLERLEDDADAKAARKVLANMKRRGERPIPLAEVRKRLGAK